MNRVEKRRQDEVMSLPFSPYAQFAIANKGKVFVRNERRWAKSEVFAFLKQNKVRVQDLDLFFDISDNPEFVNGRYVGETIKS